MTELFKSACGADLRHLTAMLERTGFPTLLLNDQGETLWSSRSAREFWPELAQPGRHLAAAVESLDLQVREPCSHTLNGAIIDFQPLTAGWVAYLSHWSPTFDLPMVGDAFPLPVFLLDCQEIYRGCNVAMAEFFGLSRDKIIGKTIAEVCQPSLAAKAFAMDKVLLQQGPAGVVSYEWDFAEEGSPRRWALIHKANVTDTSGEVCGMVGTICEISDLRRSEQKFASIFNLCPETITLTDKQTGQYLDVNAAYETLTGHSRADALGHTSFDLSLWVDPDDRKAAVEALDRNGGRLSNFETRFRRKDGTVFPALISAEETDLLGTPSIIMMTRDITEQKESAERLNRALNQAIAAFALTLEKRDPYTAGHQDRVSRLAAAIAKKLGLSQEQLEGLRLGGIIHDIGKIYVPAEILTRPGRLTEVEFAMVKTHAQVGYDIVRNVEFPWPVATIIHQHHERLDGSGYPLGLKGDEILLESQILAVADVVEAMASHRPYRPGLGSQKALDQVREGAGIHYNREAVAACEYLIQKAGYPL